MNKPRIKANAIKTAANALYYGGTLSAGLGFYNLLDDRNPVSIAVLLVFTIVVEGLLRTLLTELTDGPLTRLQPATTDASATTAKETDQ
ncbi:hypothetical protein [Streptomyces sp. NPDC046862]|uniref:hypothetical protein n=1 Tax=Streptomyces sp. NPDC046862 TaxID=3154603 RepID=UPI003455F74B